MTATRGGAHDATVRRVVVWLYLAGGALGAVALAMGSTGPLDAPVSWLTAVNALVVGSLVASLGDRLPTHWEHAALAFAAANVTAALLGEQSSESVGASGTILVFVWVCLVVGYAIERRGAFAAHLVLAATGLGLAFAERPPSVNPVGAWAMTAGSCLIAALAVRALRQRLHGALTREEHLARTDALTGLRNRRALVEAFVAEQARARRTGEPLAIVLGDLDRFKQLNDRYGHDAGDRALRRVGELLRREARCVDVVARSGGEEFVLLLPGTGVPEAREVAERLRVAVAEPGSRRDDPPLRISFGVAAVAPGAIDLADALRRADEALYEAKRAGRDRVAVAS